jgi:hypothetical protein
MTPEKNSILIITSRPRLIHRLNVLEFILRWEQMRECGERCARVQKRRIVLIATTRQGPVQADFRGVNSVGEFHLAVSQ